jgi:hypothetical protein
MFLNVAKKSPLLSIADSPSSVFITPQLPENNIVSVKDGDYIGPYHCFADCNPPCTFQWNYKLSNGTFGGATSNEETLLRQKVFRSKVLFRCVAKYNSGKKVFQDMKLYISCKYYY